MKEFRELTEVQQERAVEMEALKLVKWIDEGYPVFLARGVQRRIDQIRQEMEDLQTPWFFGSVVWDELQDELRDAVRPYVEEQLFAEPDDPEVVYGVL